VLQLTFQYRIKDKHAKRLAAQARAVNVVWNYCNETQRKAAQSGRKWLTGYDLVNLVAGCTKEGLDLLRIPRCVFACSTTSPAGNTKSRGYGGVAGKCPGVRTTAT
jgi:hypothetical protein